MDLGIIFRKKKCNHVWCRTCSKRQKKLLYLRLTQMNYKLCRHIVLTLNRKLFNGPLDAYYNSNKRVAYLIQTLKRKYGIIINKYIKILEFHNDGFVHYHLIVEKKSVGMIGNDILYPEWGLGGIRESYFKNKNEWLKFTGYFNKNGYFEDQKGHQDVLPTELIKCNVIVRRFNYSQGFEWLEKRKIENKEKLFNDLIEDDKKEYVRRTNEEIINSCGSSTRIELFMKNRLAEEYEINIPFKEIKQLFNCEFKEGVGLYAKVWKRDFKKIIKKYDENNYLLEIL